MSAAENVHNEATNEATKAAKGNPTEGDELITVEKAIDIFEKKKGLTDNGSLPFSENVRVELLNGIALSETEIKDLSEVGENELFPIFKVDNQTIIHFVGEMFSSAHVFGQ